MLRKEKKVREPCRVSGIEKTKNGAFCPLCCAVFVATVALAANSKEKGHNSFVGNEFIYICVSYLQS